MSSQRFHRIIFGCAAIATLLVASSSIGVSTAAAHPWGCWHWHVGGPAVYISVQNTAVNYWPAEYARRDIEARQHPVYLPTTNYHTHISVFDGYYGATGWSALAEIISFSGCHITHAHARYNRSYGNLNPQGLFCQEIGHTLGLDHSNTGECMGYTYYPGYNVNANAICFGVTCSTTSTSHSSSDLYNLYRYHS